MTPSNDITAAYRPNPASDDKYVSPFACVHDLGTVCHSGDNEPWLAIELSHAHYPYMKIDYASHERGADHVKANDFVVYAHDAYDAALFNDANADNMNATCYVHNTTAGDENMYTEGSGIRYRAFQLRPGCHGKFVIMKKTQTVNAHIHVDVFLYAPQDEQMALTQFVGTRDAAGNFRGFSFLAAFVRNYPPSNVYNDVLIDFGNGPEKDNVIVRFGDDDNTTHTTQNKLNYRVYNDGALVLDVISETVATVVKNGQEETHVAIVHRLDHVQMYIDGVRQKVVCCSVR